MRTKSTTQNKTKNGKQYVVYFSSLGSTDRTDNMLWRNAYIELLKNKYLLYK